MNIEVIFNHNNFYPKYGPCGDNIYGNNQHV